MSSRRPLRLNLNFPFRPGGGLFYREPMLEGAPRELIHRYLSALRKEIPAVAKDAEGFTVTSVYFGDGPLNLANCTDWQLVLRELRAAFSLEDVEINICFKPDSFSTDDYYRFYTERCEWLLLSMVSHVPEELAAAGCTHTPQDNAKAHMLFNDFGFKRFDLVLYYGLPGQTTQSFLTSLERAADMYGNHISTLPFPDSEQDAQVMDEMVDAARRFLGRRGFTEYTAYHFGRGDARICMYAEPGAEYMGLGLGAKSSMDGLLFRNTLELELYLQYPDRFDLICERLA